MNLLRPSKSPKKTMEQSHFLMLEDSDDELDV